MSKEFAILSDWEATFSLSDVTEIKDSNVAIPIPGTDAGLYDLLNGYFCSPTAPVINIDPTKIVVPLTGNAYAALPSDNGKVFIWDVPAANKTFTVPFGLAVGWNVKLFKMYNGNALTIAGSGGMTILGIDIILNNQYASAEIIVITPTQAIVRNVGL
jgi:hypothetical protein